MMRLNTGPLVIFLASFASLNTNANLVACPSHNVYRLSVDKIHSRASLEKDLKALYPSQSSATIDLLLGQYGNSYAQLSEQAQQDLKALHETDSFRQGLNMDQSLAIWTYTAINFGILNGTLRGQRQADPNTENLVKMLSCALDRLPDYRGTTSRYVDFTGVPRYFLDFHTAGNVVRYLSFTSASSCVSEKKGKQFLIHSRHGKSIVDYSAVGNGECEVIYKPGTCFHIDRNFADGSRPDGVRVEMTEIECPLTGAKAI